MAAAADSDTTDGDILVSLVAEQRAEGQAFLVVRQSSGNYYDIIGQAFALAAFVPSDTPVQLEANLKLNITAEDAAVLVGQDFITYFKHRFSDSSKYSFEARHQRLRTRVTTKRSRAAWIVWETYGV